VSQIAEIGGVMKAVARDGEAGANPYIVSAERWLAHQFVVPTSTSPPRTFDDTGSHNENADL
jgi:hypothetical protein